MRRCIITTLCLLLWMAVVWAAPRTAEQVLAIASDNVYARFSSNRLKSPLLQQPLQIADKSVSYYAVNTGGGFVLVSADDRLPAVLGYSENGDFDKNVLPPAFRFWLETYDMEALSLDSLNVVNPSVSYVATADEQPPLIACQWNQSAPFNDLAPVYDGKRHAAAGCVAVAMAQIMYAYQYPSRGVGEHSYTWISKRDTSLSAVLYADFGATIYDWKHILPYYTTVSGSVQQRAAVATLLYHCGVAVDMGYDCNVSHESGAVTSKVPKVLSTYFGYDSHFQSIRKDIYLIDSLNRIIRNELREHRPVLVSGSNSDGGHAFVCDGYDRNGYFHINWGWGGSSDGYYLLSALNPGKQGIGGTSKGYNKNTTFYIGIQPANEKALPYPVQLAADSFSVEDTLITYDESFSLCVHRIQNYGMDDYTGRIGVALYDEDEQEMVTLLKTANFSLKSNYYRTSAEVLQDLVMPVATPQGTYHVCVVYEDKNYGWLRMQNRCDDYFRTLYVDDNGVHFFDNDAPAVLTLQQPITFPADSVPRSGAPLSFAIRNTGGTFRGDVSARIYQGNFAKGQYEVIDSLSIRRNQTFSSALQQVFDERLVAGKLYKMKLCWRADSQDSWHEFTPADYGTLTFRICEMQDVPTVLPEVLPTDVTILSKNFVMHLPIGDMYIVVTKDRYNNIQRYKTIQHK